MPDLRPAPHFGTTSDLDGGGFVARLLVPDEETAACLDGLVMSNNTVSPLLRLAVTAATWSIYTDLTDGDGFAESIKFTNDLGVHSARLPLLARILKYRTVREEGELSMAESEGWDAEIREMFVGKIPGFTISGKERDALVREVRAALKLIDADRPDAKSRRRELKAILRDTGKKRGTGEGCTLSTLPMPALVEWLRLFGPDVRSPEFWSLPKKTRKKLKRRHELIRDMWVRVGREIKTGSEGAI